MTHPVALICYNRPHYLARVLAAMERDRPEPLYIFSDGPKDAKDAIAVAEVRKLVHAIDWAETIVIEQKHNIGLARSVVEAVDHVLAYHEAVIVLEDDCLPGTRFFEFMYKCLDRYWGDERVMAVNGYLPFSFIGSELCQGQAALVPYFQWWGWATWRRAWQQYIRDDELASIPIPDGFAWRGFLNDKTAGIRDVWSPGWFLSIALHSGLCVSPIATHITNLDDGGLAFQQDNREITCLPESEKDNAICRDLIMWAFARGLTKLSIQGEG
jgi:hypothetical protein